jgi:hypothetical protein
MLYFMLPYSSKGCCEYTASFQTSAKTAGCHSTLKHCQTIPVVAVQGQRFVRNGQEVREIPLFKPAFLPKLVPLFVVKANLVGIRGDIVCKDVMCNCSCEGQLLVAVALPRGRPSTHNTSYFAVPFLQAAAKQLADAGAKSKVN